MNIAKIKKRCVASRQWIIIDADDGNQWLSDGANCYAIVGIRLREGFIQDVFGLSDKQMDKMIVRTEKRAGALYWTGTSVYGEELEELRTVWAYEQKIVALRNGDGLLYIPEDAILAACGKDDYVNFYLAHDRDGKLLVAVYHGMFCEALLSPVRDDIAEQISGQLARVGTMPILRTEIKKEVEDDEVDVREG